MKFSIRDLLLVTVIVALAGAWWLDRSSLARMLDSDRSLRLDAESAAAMQMRINEFLEGFIKEEGWSISKLPNSSAPRPNSTQTLTP